MVWRVRVVIGVVIIIGIVSRRPAGSVPIGVSVSEVEAKSESPAVTIARIAPVASATTIVSTVIAAIIASVPTISTAVIAAIVSAAAPATAAVKPAAPAAVTTTLCKSGLWSQRERGQHNCHAENSQYDGFIHFYTS